MLDSSRLVGRKKMTKYYDTEENECITALEKIERKMEDTLLYLKYKCELAKSPNMVWLLTSGISAISPWVAWYMRRMSLLIVSQCG